MSMMMKQFFATAILFLIVSSGFSQSRSTFSGTITDKLTGEALIGAHLWFPEFNQGTATNAYGFYSISMPKGHYRVEITAVGYWAQTDSIVLTGDLAKPWHMVPKTETLSEVTISGTREITELTQMSRVSLPIASLKNIPPFLGELDIVKTIQLFPGVSRGSEGNNYLYVRGGSADQNLILLDGVPVYNVNHVFGFLSVFNGDAINSAEFYTGGFPARYGGRLSAIVDITMHEGNHAESAGLVSVGTLAAKAMVEGPIGKQTSYLLSIRRTYLDALARPLAAGLSNSGGISDAVIPRAYFYDLNGKINHQFSDRSRIFLSYYGGQDQFSTQIGEQTEDPDLEVLRNESLTEGLKWGNQTTALRWNYLWNQKLFMNTSFTFSNYGFGVFNSNHVAWPDASPAVAPYFFETLNHSQIQDLGGKVEMEWYPRPNHEFRFGINVTRQRFEPGTYTLNSSINDTLIGSPIQKGWNQSAYAEDDFRINEFISGNIGLHAAMFTTGDTTYPSIQPRVALRAQVHERVALKTSFSSMQQPLHMLTSSGIGLPLDQWVPATNTIAPQKGWVTALGAAISLPHQLSLSVEGYYKQMYNLLEYLDGEGFSNPLKEWQEKVAVGDGEAYGLELLLQKKEGRFSGWAGYTLSWSWRDFETLNFGERFPFRYDRRHNLTLAANGALKDHINAGVTWVYTSGEALTLPQGSAIRPLPISYPSSPTNPYWPPRGVYGYYGARNSYRMSAYHRLDVSVSFEKQKKRGVRTWILGAYNAYGRQNPLYVDLRRVARLNANGELEIAPELVQYSIVPFPIPYFSYQFQF